MTTATAKKILDRYYDGNTSLAEEQRLRNYFARPDVPAELQNDARLFRMLAAETPPKTSSDFDRRLMSALEAENQQPRTAAKVVRLGMRRWMSVAAVFVGLIACVFLMRECQHMNTTVQHSTRELPIAMNEQEETPIDWSKYELEDEAAVAAALSALKVTSSKLNQGTEAISGEMQKLRYLTVR